MTTVARILRLGKDAVGENDVFERAVLDRFDVTIGPQHVADFVVRAGAHGASAT